MMLPTARHAMRRHTSVHWAASALRVHSTHIEKRSGQADPIIDPLRRQPGSEQASTRGKVSRTLRGPFGSKMVGISELGIHDVGTIYANLSHHELAEHERANLEGTFTKHGGAFAVDTGIFTGRSPKDKWIVRNVGSESEENVWWGSVNQPMEPATFDALFDQAVAHYNTLEEAYVFDGYCGANPASQKRVRFVHEKAWQQHFVTNMFIRPIDPAEVDGFEPDFTIINASSQVNQAWREQGLNSEACATATPCHTLRTRARL
jgi:phosphoenolpyruvate carboxykinase (ATP)